MTRAAALAAAACAGACGVQLTASGGGVTTGDASTTSTTSDATTTSSTSSTSAAPGSSTTGTSGGGGAGPACKADGALCARKEDCCSNACSGKFCGPGAGACKPGDAPVALASNDEGIYTLTIDPDYVYFSIPQGDTCAATAKVLRVPKQGGTPEIVATPALVPSALAVDETRLFWPDRAAPPCSTTGDGSHALFIGPKDGDPAGTTLSIGTNDYDAREIALDDDHVYWIHAPFSVHRADKSTGWSVPLAYEENWPEGIALDGSTVYWSCDKGLRRTPKTGKGDVETIGPWDFRFAKLAVDADALYVSNLLMGDYVKGQVYRMSKDGSTQTPLATLVGERPGPITIDDTHVFWTTATPFVAGTPPVGHVMRVAKSGGEVVSLAEGKTPGAIAVDDSCVYWTDETLLMKGPK